MSLRGSIVAIAVALAGCTRPNPSFGYGLTDGGSSSGGEVSATTEDPSSPTTGSGDTLTTDSVGTQEGTASSTTDDPSVGESGTVGESTGAVACSIAEPPRFGVLMADGVGEIAPPCGGLRHVIGMATAIADNEMRVAICPDDACSCAEPLSLVTLTFGGLSPSPVDVLGGNSACMAVSLAFHTEADGCGLAWVTMEPAQGIVEHPAFLATNSPVPAWSLLVPGASFGGKIEVCEDTLCEQGALPHGYYQMMLGGAGPFEPGAPANVVLDPYTNGPGNYALSVLYAQLDASCVPAIGWAAVYLP